MRPGLENRARTHHLQALTLGARELGRTLWAMYSQPREVTVTVEEISSPFRLPEADGTF